MFINILTKGGFRGCTCLKCTSLSKDTLMRVFFVGALETSAPPTKPLMDTKVSIL